MNKFSINLLLLLFLLICTAVNLHAQVITTLAGNAHAGYGGDGGPAVLAQLDAPGSAAVDANGNVYILDQHNHRVRKVDAAGMITTVAGNGTAGYGGDGGDAMAAQINATFVAVDFDGNLYLSDSHRIRKVDVNSHVITTIAGDGTAGYSGDGGLAINAQLHNPSQLAFDSNHNLYISDTDNACIRKINATTGTISTLAGTGIAGYSGDDGAAVSAQLNSPGGLAIDGSDRVHVSDAGNNRIRVIDQGTGIIRTVAGNGNAANNGDGGNATGAAVMMSSASSLALSSNGNVYFAADARIREVNMITGMIRTVAGTGNQGYSGDGGPVTLAEFNNPLGLVFDLHNNLYVADAGSSVVRKLLPCILSYAAPSSAQTVCENATAQPLLLNVTGSGTLSYQWYKNTNNNIYTGSAVAGATGASYTPSSSVSEAGVYYYYATVTGTCGSITSSPRSVFTSAITAQPSIASQNVCQGGTPAALSVTSTGYGSVSYQWYKSSTNNNTSGSIIAGETQASYLPNVSTAGNMYYYVKVRNYNTNNSLIKYDCTITSQVSGVVAVIPQTRIYTQPTTAGQTLCQNAAVAVLSVVVIGANLTFQWYSNLTSSNIGGTPIPGATISQYTPSSSAPGTNYYYVAVNGSCGAATSNISGAIVVVPPVVSFTTQPATQGQTVCENEAATPLTAVATGTGPITYQWFFKVGTFPQGTPINGATTSTYTPPSTIVRAAQYYAVATGANNCPASSNMSGLIVVNAATKIQGQPSIAGQTLCQDASANTLAISATGSGTLTYQWYSNATNSNSGGTPIINATSKIYQPSSATPGTTYYYATVTGSCVTVTSSVSGAIIVNAKTIITTQLSSDAQTTCLNGTLNPLTISTAFGTYYTWFSNTTNTTTGGVVVANGSTLTSYTPLSTATGTKYYYVTVSGSCGTLTSAVSGAITVNPLTIIITQPAPTGESACPNTAVSPLTIAATGTGTLSYQWYSNASNSNTGGTVIQNATNNSYTPIVSGTPGATYYYATVTAGCGSVSSNATPIYTAGIIAQPSTTNENNCQSDQITPLSATIAGYGAPSYQWYRNTTNSNVGGTAVNAYGTGATYMPTYYSGTNYYYVKINGTLTNGSSCPVTSNASGRIITNAQTYITQHPSTSGQTVCINGGNATPLTVTATGGNLTYQWFKNMISSNTGGIVVDGATSASYTPTSGAYYYYVIVNGSCGSYTSYPSGYVAVNIPTVITTQPSSVPQALCQNLTTPAVTPLSVAGTGIGTINYQWFSNATNSIAGGSPITGANTSTFTPPTSTLGTSYYFASIRGSCGTVFSTVSGAVTVGQITAITTSPLSGPQTFCENASTTTLTAGATGTGTIAYQWYYNTTNAYVGGKTMFGSTGTSISPSSSTAGTKYYFATAIGSCGPTVVTGISGAITINPATVITTQPSAATQNVCLNGTTNPLTVIAAGTGTLTYQWYSNTTNTNTGGTIIQNATSNSYTPPSNVAGTRYYFVIVTGACGTATSNPSGAMSVTTGPTIITQPSTSAQAVCLNASFNSLSVTASGSGTITYQWYRSTTATNSGGSAISGATSASYTPQTSVGGTQYYYVSVSDNCATISSVVSGPMMVNALTDIPSQFTGATQTVCQNGLFNQLLIGAMGTGTLTYQWYSNTTASNVNGTPISGETGAGYTPSSASVGTKYYYATVTGGCGTLTTNPSGAMTTNPLTAIVTQPSSSSQSVCQNGAFSPLTVSATGTGIVTYQWYANSVASNTGGSAINNTSSASYTPSSSAVGTQYYYAIASGGCGSVASNVSGARITNPLTTITLQPSTADQIVCQNNPHNALTAGATGAGAVSYQWYYNASNSNAGGSLINGATASSYTPSSATTGGLFYYVTASTACGTVPSATSGMIVTKAYVLPSFSGQPSATNQNVCQNSPVNTLSTDAVGPGVITYQWYSNTVNNNSSGTLISGATASDYTPSSAATGTRYYYVRATGTCGSTPSTVSGAVIVNAPVIITSFSGPSQVCPNTSYTYTANLAGGHQPGYTYTWTKPANWTVNSQSNNTIQYALPSSPNYGAVQVYVKSGACTTQDGRTAMPCSARMETGDDALDTDGTSVVISPNPANAAVIVTLTEVTEVARAIRVYSPWGLSMTGVIEKGKRSTTIDTSDLSSGLYFFQVEMGGELVLRKVLIMH
jgi:hypothetical protein